MPTPDEVLRLKKPADGFLCPLSANNEYGIEFLSFSIGDYDTKATIFEVAKDRPPPNGMELDFSAALGEDSFRKIKYTFSEDVLKLPLISTSLTFKVGEKPLPNFRMIERHYVGDKLVKSYDFTFGFCIPGSVNSWDAVYDVPPLDDIDIEAMVAKPYATESDSFYFVGDELVMHNKASYRYLREDQAQGKRSYAHCRRGEAKRGDVRSITQAMSEAKCSDEVDMRADAKAGAKEVAADSKGSKDLDY